MKTKKVGRENFTEGNKIDYGVQIVAVGNCVVGKTHLILTYKTGNFPDLMYMCTNINDYYTSTINVSFIL